jgi:S1-C subfamily serine protease
VTIGADVLVRLRNGVCAVGYLNTPLDVYEKDPRRSAFKIIGTGFVAEPGLMITNRHVIRKLELIAAAESIPRSQVFLQFNYASDDGEWIQISLVPFERGVVAPPETGLDVAIMKYDPESDAPGWDRVQPVPFSPPVRLHVGQAVGCFGFAFGSDHLTRPQDGHVYRFGPVLQQGYVSALAPFDNAKIVERILLDLRTSVGMSGSPVFDSATGTVVGIHDAGREATTAYAIPLDADRIAAFAGFKSPADFWRTPGLIVEPMETRRPPPKQ